MNLYNQCKDMPNPSAGLLRALKKNSWGRIWAMKSDYRKSHFVSLPKLKKMDLREVELRIGGPRSFGKGAVEKDDGKSVLSRSFTGRHLVRSMFGSKIDQCVCLVGIGHKDTGTWMIDVTDKVVEAVNKIGACALSEAHCKFELISPHVKQCKFCGRKIYRKVEVSKSVYWVNK